MTTATIDRTEHDVSELRALVYEVLAHAFAYPSMDHRRALRELTGEWPSVGEPFGPALAHQGAALLDGLPQFADQERAYTLLFTHSASRDCPLFETAYTSRETFQQAQMMADIAGFYSAFGVQILPGVGQPDHLCAELEFMQFLALKEAYAREALGAPRVAQTRKVQRLFLTDHLGVWAGPFGMRVAARDPHGWYGDAGRLVQLWLERECRSLGATPVLVAGDPRMTWPEPDNGECGDADDPTGADGAAGCEGCAFAGPEASPAHQYDGRLPLPVL